MDFLPDSIDYKLKTFVYGLLIFHAVAVTIWIILAVRSNKESQNIDKAIEGLLKKKN